jgi:hypothetical protein
MPRGVAATDIAARKATHGDSEPSRGQLILYRLRKLIGGRSCGEQHGAATVRRFLLQCISEQEQWEREYAGYDVKIGLAACYRVEVVVNRTTVAKSGAEEIRAIENLLRTMMCSQDLLQGEYSTEAATIGSILGRFSAGVTG